MSEPKGFFPPEQLEGRDPRGAIVLKREIAARRREKKTRQQMKERMVTRQSLFGPVTKSAFEWREFAKKQTTISVNTLKRVEKRVKHRKKFRKPRQGFFKLVLTKQGWVTSPELVPACGKDDKSVARKMVAKALNIRRERQELWHAMRG